MSPPPHRATDNEQRLAQAFPLVLACYFLLQAGIRIAQQGALELDEAEQVFHSQQLLLGYDTQPPLYVWLQWLSFQVFGVSHAGLALLRNALLFGLYLSVFHVARMLLGTFAAAAVSASLVLMTPLGWEAQVDRTHSTLATSLAAGALWAYFSLLRHPARAKYALLGLLLGLGMQAKYNFAIFVLALVAASLIVTEHRKLVWTRDAWLTVVVALVCALPHGLWFLEHVEAATSDTLAKMSSGGMHADYAANVANGFSNALVSIIAFATPLWIFLAIAYRSPKQVVLRLDEPDARFFMWLFASGLACIAALVFAGQLANIKSRWLQPLLFALPIAVFVVLTPGTASVYRRLLWMACVFAALMTVLLSVRPQIQSALGRNARIRQPYAALGAELKQRFPDVRAIAVQDHHLGGNIHLQLTQLPALLLPDACEQMPRIQGKVLVLVYGPDDARRFLEKCPGVLVEERGTLSAASKPERLRFDYLLVRGARAGRGTRQ